jgi:hypothetical protein
MTQGMAGGVIVGLIIVALLAWRDVRLTRPISAESAESNARRLTSRRVLLITGGLILILLVSGAALLLGAVSGSRGAYHRRFLEEREALAPALASDPAFERLEIHERSNGGVFLVGELKSAADFERLRDIAIRAVGESRAKSIVRGIDVPPEHN